MCKTRLNLSFIKTEFWRGYSVFKWLCKNMQYFLSTNFLDPCFIMFKNMMSPRCVTCTHQAPPWTSRGSPGFDFWMFNFWRALSNTLHYLDIFRLHDLFVMIDRSFSLSSFLRPVASSSVQLTFAWRLTSLLSLEQESVRLRISRVEPLWWGRRPTSVYRASNSINSLLHIIGSSDS